MKAQTENVDDSKSIPKRAFICCNDPFPFGTANSNYIRNLASALNTAGFEVLIIGLKERQTKVELCEECGKYNDIKYVNIISRKSRLPFRIRNHLCFGKRQMNILNRYDIKNEDYIFIYTDFVSVSKLALKHYKELNVRGHLVYCIVEWFRACQYKLSWLNLDYILWRFHFEMLMPKYNKIMAISQNLQRHFLQKGCTSFVLPCLTDTAAIEYKVKNKSVGEKFNFIYSGAAINKDSIEGMVKGLLMLNSDELGKIQMHFTTMTRDKLVKASKCQETDLAVLDEVLVFHGWLNYDELLKLYSEMDFLFLAREENITTLSNFPSKVPELLSFGVIPVCSAVGDYTGIYLKDGVDAIIFNSASPEACAQGLRRAVSMDLNDLRRMSMNARQCAEKNFDYRSKADYLKKYLSDESEVCKA